MTRTDTGTTSAATTTVPDATVRVDDLSISYAAGKRRVPVVRGVSFTIEAGRTLGLVGESGSGKSTVARTLLAHLRAGSAIDAGTVRVDGADVFALSPAGRRALRGGTASVVAQNAGQALTPSMRVGEQIREALRAHGEARRPRTGRRAGPAGPAAGPRRDRPPVPAPVVRRAAAAHRHRDGRRRPAARARPRRTDHRPGRRHAGRGPRPGRRPRSAARHGRPARQPRPRGGVRHGGRDRRDARRRGRRARRHGGALRRSAARVHACPAGRGAGRTTAWREGSRRPGPVRPRDGRLHGHPHRTSRARRPPRGDRGRPGDPLRPRSAGRRRRRLVHDRRARDARRRGRVRQRQVDARDGAGRTGAGRVGDVHVRRRHDPRRPARADRRTGARPAARRAARLPERGHVAQPAAHRGRGRRAAAAVVQRLVLAGARGCPAQPGREQGRSSPTDCPRSCPVGSASASGSPAHWPRSRRS